jgi:hypothetical protein
LAIGSIVGDIKVQAEAGDLIINAWDPHSAPGNGNDGDASFDGHLGRASSILLTQSVWFNPAMRRKENYRFLHTTQKHPQGLNNTLYPSN